MAFPVAGWMAMMMPTLTRWARGRSSDTGSSRRWTAGGVRSAVAHETAIRESAEAIRVRAMLEERKRAEQERMSAKESAEFLESLIVGDTDFNYEEWGQHMPEASKDAISSAERDDFWAALPIRARLHMRTLAKYPTPSNSSFMTGYLWAMHDSGTLGSGETRIGLRFIALVTNHTSWAEFVLSKFQE